MYAYQTCGLTEARGSGVVSDAGHGPLGYEAEVELLFGKVFHLKDVAEKLGISPRQVQAHIDDGSLVAVNVGRGCERRDLRILEGDLDGFVRRRSTDAVTAATFGRPKRGTRAVPASGPNPGYIERRARRIARDLRDGEGR